MSYAHVTTTMTALIRAIVATLQAHPWPSPIAQIGFRGPESLLLEDPAALATPALFLHLVERSLDDTQPTFPGRIARRCTWQLYCLLGEATDDLSTELFEFTESACALIERREITASPQRGNRWGLGNAVEYPLNLTDTEGDLALQGVATRLVTWEQTVYLAETEPAT